MKQKLLSFITVTFISLMAYGQSLSITFYDSVAYGHPTNTNDIEAKAHIKNNSNLAMEVKVKRYYDRNNPLIDSNAICWGFCFDTDVDVSPISISIGAGQTDNFNFTGHVYPDMDGVIRQGEIMYTFFDSENPNDSASVVILYELTASFSSNIVISQIKNVNTYPNPAHDFFIMTFDNPLDRRAQLIITDIVGNVVKKVQLNPGNTQYRISTADLRSGMYLYSFVVDGHKQFTKRINVVKK